MRDGDVVVAAILLHEHQQPSVMSVRASPLRAQALGLTRKPRVKTLAPGSTVVTDTPRGGSALVVESCGFHLVGYGCTTCIGIRSRRADLERHREHDLVATAFSAATGTGGSFMPISSGLSVAALVVAYAIAGTVDDIQVDPIGQDQQGTCTSGTSGLPTKKWRTPWRAA